MRSFNCLDKNEKIARPYFLEASAGTGKTFAIEHIFTRLLLEEEEIECENILVVTFTNAATRELKARIHEALESALSQLRSKTPTLPYLIDLEEEVTLKSIKKLELALLHFDRAQIFTIHSFCFYCLKTKGFDALVNLDVEKMGDGSIKNELKLALLDTLRLDLEDPVFGEAEIFHFLKFCKKDIHLLVSKLMGLIASELSFEEIKSFKELFEEFRNELLAFYEANQHFDLNEAFLVEGPKFKGLCNTKKEIHQDFLNQAKLLKNEFSIEDFEKLVYSDSFFLEKFTEENLKKNATSEYGPSFYSLKEALFPIYESAKDPHKTLMKLAVCSRNRILEKYDENSVFSFDAYLTKMLKALENGSFKKKIQQLYKAAIIDEFQDTDPVQWQIFKTLFKEEDAFPLYLVGDPKQSIYAFRSADLPTYLDAASCFKEASIRSLDTNYRSEPLLISALNQLFSKKNAKNWLGDSNSIEYKEVKASHFFENTQFKDAGAHVHVAIFEDEMSASNQFPSKRLEEEKVFPYLAKEIQKIVSENGASPREIAILIRDRYQGMRLQKAFEKYQIPLQIKSFSPLVETRAYLFFFNLISWLTAPDDRLLRSLLAHPFIGFDSSDLRIKEESSEVILAICKLKELKALCIKEGFLNFYSRFKKTTFHKLPFLASLLKQKDASDYQDITSLFEVVLSKVAPPYLLEEILLFLEEMQKKEESEDASFMQKAAAKEDAVIVMTTHLSKGLEFPYVFALGIASRVKKASEVLRLKDKYELLDETKSDHIKHLSNLHEEKMRQLYVALTRAKRRAYLIFCLEKEDSHIHDHERSPMENFCKALCGSYQKEDLVQKIEQMSVESLKLEKEEETLEPGVYKAEKKQVSLPPPRKYQNLLISRGFGSYSSLAQPKMIEEEKIQQLCDTKNVFSLPSSKETGNLLHAILEKLFERGLHTPKNLQAVRALIEQEVQGSHLAGWEDVLEEMIESVMHLRLQAGSLEFALASLQMKDLLTELPFFLYENPAHTIKGFIDLCFVYENKMYLLDWKSNFLGNELLNYQHEQLEKCMRQHDYFMQAKFYSEAIRHHLSRLSELEYGGMFYVFLRGLKKETSSGVYFVP